jgi:hypothetical protein
LFFFAPLGAGKKVSEAHRLPRIYARKPEEKFFVCGFGFAIETGSKVEGKVEMLLKLEALSSSIAASRFVDQLFLIKNVTARLICIISG